MQASFDDEPCFIPTVDVSHCPTKGMQLPGAYQIGDRVVSLITFRGANGELAAGDVGIVTGPSKNRAAPDADQRVNCKFPTYLSINVKPNQVRKEAEAWIPVYVYYFALPPCAGLVGGRTAMPQQPVTTPDALEPPTLPQIKEQFHKTKMCKFFKEGTCTRGANCSYAHSRADLQDSPDLKKTRLCGDFINGNCFDPQCNFAHGQDELRFTVAVYKTVMCRGMMKGRCRDGPACRFAH